MNRAQLEHVVRAAATIVEDAERRRLVAGLIRNVFAQS